MCVSSGNRVTGRSEATIGTPIERLGTKWPSITSMWIRSAPARSASRDVLAEPREIRREDRGRDFDFMRHEHGPQRYLPQLPIAVGDFVYRVLPA